MLPLTFIFVGCFGFSAIRGKPESSPVFRFHIRSGFFAEASGCFSDKEEGCQNQINQFDEHKRGDNAAQSINKEVSGQQS